jgi:hypothetical protein
MVSLIVIWTGTALYRDARPVIDVRAFALDSAADPSRMLCSWDSAHASIDAAPVCITDTAHGHIAIRIPRIVIRVERGRAAALPVVVLPTGDALSPIVVVDLVSKPALSIPATYP